MTDKLDEDLYDVWDKRWRDDNPFLLQTAIGLMMFRAKEKALARTVSGLDIQKVIEVGCGLGHTLSFYQKAGFDCIGIDTSSNAIAVCNKKGLSAVLQRVEDVNKQYDLVSSDGMLEHFLNFEPYARHMMRISSRFVLLIQPNHGSFCGKTLVYFAELFRKDKNVFEYNYRIEDFISVFSKYGFRIIQNRPIFFDVFRLLLFKKE